MSGFGVRVNSPQVIHETIDGEVIVINLTSGTYYSLKGSGAELWGIISDSPGIDEAQISDGLASHYVTPRDELGAAVLRFVEQLRAEGLVADAEPVAAAAANVTSNGGPQTFETPRLEKYTDMQDLVLLDPVHQVDEAGWPQPKPDAAAQGWNG